MARTIRIDRIACQCKFIAAAFDLDIESIFKCVKVYVLLSVEDGDEAVIFKDNPFLNVCAGDGKLPFLGLSIRPVLIISVIC